MVKRTPIKRAEIYIHPATYQHVCVFKVHQDITMVILADPLEEPLNTLRVRVRTPYAGWGNGIAESVSTLTRSQFDGLLQQACGGYDVERH